MANQMEVAIELKKDSRFSNAINQFNCRIKGSPAVIKIIQDSLESDGWSIDCTTVSDDLIE